MKLKNCFSMLVRVMIVRAAAAFALTCAACFAQMPSPQTIRIVALYPHLPILVALEHGIFAKYGLDVQIENVPSSDVLRERLASGKADVAHAAVDNGVAMVESAKVDVAIVMGGEGSVNELIAQPDIHSVGDLRGKTVIVDAPNTAYALQLKKILLLQGLMAGKDYEIKPIGGTPIRLQAMQNHKEYAASILGPPTSIQAKSAGLVSLGNTLDLIGPYQATGAFTRRDWAREHSDLLERYLAAYIEGQRWLLAGENKPQVLALIKKQWRLSDEQADQTYALIQGHVWYQPDARLNIDAFSTVLKLRAEMEGQWGGHAPAAAKYYDPVYYENALARTK
jgi:ABC-type nitrate/sulfonate/bicarbonate transport system substrate-binding protein